jgi:hypothetical protein
VYAVSFREAGDVGRSLTMKSAQRCASTAGVAGSFQQSAVVDLLTELKHRGPAALPPESSVERLRALRPVSNTQVERRPARIRGDSQRLFNRVGPIADRLDAGGKFWIDDLAILLKTAQRFLQAAPD